MKAKKKPISSMTPADLGVEVQQQLVTEQVGLLNFCLVPLRPVSNVSERGGGSAARHQQARVESAAKSGTVRCG